MDGERTRKSRRPAPGRGEPTADEIADEGGNRTGDTTISGPAIAAILNVTEQRIRQLVDEGMPRLGRGMYPLMGCVHWYIDYWRTKALGREADAGKKRKQDLEITVLEAKALEASGHLINRQETRMVWSSAFMRLGKMMDQMPGQIGRELSWSPDTIRMVRARMDSMRETFVRDSAEFIDVVEEPKANAGGTKRKS